MANSNSGVISQQPIFRKDSIPKWILAYSWVVVLILSFQIFSVFYNPSYWFPELIVSDLITKKVLVTLAGRNIVMLVVTLIALRSRNAMFLILTFLMHFVREFWDMGMVPVFEGVSVKSILQASSFLVFLIPYVFAIKKLKSLVKLP